MAFIHEASTLCVKSELDLFRLPPTQSSIEGGQWVHVKPLNSLGDGSTIEFVVAGNGENYMDLRNAYLKVRCRLTDRVGEDLADTVKGGPINNWGDSLFSNVEVSLNQTPITPPSNLYPYRAYLETLLSYDIGAKQSHLSMGLWYDDDCAEMGETDGAKNTGLGRRFAHAAGGKPIELIVNLHSEIFAQEKYLINGVELKVRLVKKKDAFHLMAPAGTAIKVKLEDVVLIVRKVKINPNVMKAHALAMLHAPARYPITRIEIKSNTIPAGVSSKEMDNIFLGQLPKRVIVGFVTNTAFNGSFTENPFNFQHFNLNYFALYVDGEQYPSRPLQLDFANNQFIDAYHTLFTATGIRNSDKGNSLSREEYPQGNTLIAIDLTPDLSAGCDHWNLTRNGNLRLEVHFADALRVAINCIVYAEFDNLIEIDQHRSIRVDFNS